MPEKCVICAAFMYSDSAISTISASVGIQSLGLLTLLTVPASAFPPLMLLEGEVVFSADFGAAFFTGALLGAAGLVFVLMVSFFSQSLY